jgi:uracil-DNA glycosylase family 4
MVSTSRKQGGPRRTSPADVVESDVPDDSVSLAAARRYRNLAGVERAIVGCDRCDRLRRHCHAVAMNPPARYRGETYWARPVPGYGDPRARLLVVGLAPAANGGNRTGRVFTGDSSGNWLYETLHHFGFANQPFSTGRNDGLVLTGVYVTAGARCAPPQNRPTPAEFARCREYLAAETRLLSDVRVVVTLGSLGHEQWLRASGWWPKLSPRERPKFGHGAETRLADGTWLLCSYHPSQQNTNTGKLTRPMFYGVFERARALIDAER